MLIHSWIYGLINHKMNVPDVHGLDQSLKETHIHEVDDGGHRKAPQFLPRGLKVIELKIVMGAGLARERSKIVVALILHGNGSGFVKAYFRSHGR